MLGVYEWDEWALGAAEYRGAGKRKGEGTEEQPFALQTAYFFGGRQDAGKLKLRHVFPLLAAACGRRCVV